MDLATLLGLIIGILVVGLAVMSGSDLWIFLNLPGFLIVIGGTFAATLIKFSLSSIFIAFKLGIKSAFISAYENPRALIDTSIDLAGRARKEGMLALEQVEVNNQFYKRGLRLCIDGHALEVVRKALTSEMELSIQRHEEGGKIFRGIGETAPAMGMIGTLVGLVQMLSSLEDPATIGPAMAVALLTTLYGALIANLIALPIADKLESKTEEERTTKELILEAVTQIHRQQSPMVLADILEAYLPEGQRAKSAEDDDGAEAATGQET